MRVTGRREWKLLDLTSTSWLLLCLKKNASSCILRSMVSACLLFALRQQAEFHVLASLNQEVLMDRTCDAAGRDLTKRPPTWQSLEVLRSLTCSRCRAEYAENHNSDRRYRAILDSPFSSPSIRVSHTDNVAKVWLANSLCGSPQLSTSSQQNSRTQWTRQMPSFSNLSRQGTIHSSLTSYRNNPRTRLRNTCPYQYGTEGMAIAAVGSHGFARPQISGNIMKPEGLFPV
jgi:hypothetical protein